jgi:pimeloyl-ACP methyl ester carboxylesterase
MGFLWNSRRDLPNALTKFKSEAALCRALSSFPYKRFGAQGGDWGAFIASRLGFGFPERMIGIHLNLLAVRRDPKMVADPIGSSFWPYYARMHGPWPIPEGSTVDVPTGYVEFPKEILRPPRSVAERMYTDIRRWTVMPKGGHFAALEQPEALAVEIRAFFRALR